MSRFRSSQRNQPKILLKNQNYSKYPGGHSKSQATGITEGFFGAWNFRVPDFLSTKFSQVFFGWLDLSRNLFRYSKQSEDSWKCFVLKNFVFHVISFNTFWKFLRHGNSAWDIFGANFWSRDFFGFDFCPHSIIPPFEIRSSPPWVQTRSTLYHRLVTARDSTLMEKIWK